MRSTITAGYLTLVALMMGYVAQTDDNSHWHILMIVGGIITAVWLAFGLYLIRTESKTPVTKTDSESGDDGCDT